MGRAADRAGGRRRLPGLRTAAVVYLVVVVLGLAGAASYAAWSQRGAVSASIAVETWDPAAVRASSVTCSARSTVIDLGDNHLEVGFEASPEATGYELSLRRSNGTITGPVVVTQPKGSIPVNMGLIRLGGSDNYTLKIVPIYQGEKTLRGEPTYRSMTASKLLILLAEMKCGDYSGPGF